MTNEIATFGGGCFWCLEAVYNQTEGVVSAISGYMGGSAPHPTYQQVCAGNSGHAEVVQVTYDPAAITYRDLLEILFVIHDPTTLNRQGNDVGTQYRSVIYYHSPEQKAEAERMIAELTEQKAFDSPIVTTVEPAPAFYPAEAYHQHYFENNPHQGYCAFVVAPKVQKFRKHFNERVKAGVRQLVWTGLLTELLPTDLPNREIVIDKSGRHLQMITEVNEYMNLTRITTPREAVVKHILDSILPWKLFAKARSIMDAGTGAGLPGIPLALVFPETRFLLVESVQKKARFVQSVVDALELKNVEVSSQRAEELLRTRKVDIITARAMAPLERAVGYFAPGFKTGARALLYKGPDAETEIGEAVAEARKRKVNMRVVLRYDLPDGLGSRSIVEISS